jgi:hypothetical protein
MHTLTFWPLRRQIEKIFQQKFRISKRLPAMVIKARNCWVTIQFFEFHCTGLNLIKLLGAYLGA